MRLFTFTWVLCKSVVRCPPILEGARKGEARRLEKGVERMKERNGEGNRKEEIPEGACRGNRGMRCGGLGLLRVVQSV